MGKKQSNPPAPFSRKDRAKPPTSPATTSEFVKIHCCEYRITVCPKCGGSGKMWLVFLGHHSVERKCKECNGTGDVSMSCNWIEKK